MKDQLEELIEAAHDLYGDKGPFKFITRRRGSL